MSRSARAAWRAPAIAAALACSGQGVFAQQGSTPRGSPMSVLVSTDTGYDGVTSTAPNGASVAMRDAPGRLHAEFAHGLTSRRWTVRFWSGATVPIATASERKRFTGQAEALSIDASTVLSRRAHLDFMVHASAAPIDLFSALGSSGPTTVPSTTSSSSLPTGRVVRFEGLAALTRTLGRRASYELSVAHEDSSALDRTPVRTDSAGGILMRRIGPFSKLRAGYRFGMARTGTGTLAAPDRRHDVDLGVDYARPLGFGGHTRFTFATGTTVFVTAGERRLRVSISSTLERDVNANWNTRVEYRRPIEYVAGFTQPFLSDAVTFVAAGRMSRAARLSITSGVSRGSVGVSGSGSGFSSISTAGRLSIPVSRAWRVEFEAHASEYELTAAETQPSWIPEHFVRRGARAVFVWSWAGVAR